MLERFDKDSRRILKSVAALIVLLVLYKLAVKPDKTFTVLFEFTLTLVAFLYILTVHEVSHGYMASLFGDPTARMRGRLSLNPLKHLDVLGIMMLFSVHIGWAKPVPVDPRRMRYKALALPMVALAGPLSNILFAFILFGLMKSYLGGEVFKAFIQTGQKSILLQSGWSGFSASIFSVMFSAFYINVMLAAFNLIPLPPLDGSKILWGILPKGGKRFIESMEKYGLFILFILFLFGYLRPIINTVFIFLLNNIFLGLL